MKTYISFLLFCIAPIILIYNYLYTTSLSTPRPVLQRICRKWYVDIGSNIGVQVRKLYEPHKYPNAPILPIFRDYLTVQNIHTDLCVVGFEMNPAHTQRLQYLEKTYTETCKYKVTFVTDTAVSLYNGNASFWSDEAYEFQEWGASTVKNWNKGKAIQVKAIDLQSYLRKYVLSTSPDTIVMKMDIEGSEQSVLPSLLASGILCHHVDVIFIEFHPSFADIGFIKDHIEEVLSRGGCKTKVMHIDDKSYIHDIASEPAC